MPMKYEDRVRLIIKNHLSAIEESIRYLETGDSRGRLFPDGCDMPMVAEAVAECWAKPSLNTISNLQETIRAFLSMCDYQWIEVG